MYVLMPGRPDELGLPPHFAAVVHNVPYLGSSHSFTAIAGNAHTALSMLLSLSLTLDDLNKLGVKLIEIDGGYRPPKT